MKKFNDIITQTDESMVPVISAALMIGAVLGIGSCENYEKDPRIDFANVMRNWMFDNKSNDIIVRLNNDKDIEDLRKEPRYKQDKEWNEVFRDKVDDKDLDVLLKAQKGTMKA